MPLNIDSYTYDIIIDRIRADVKSILPDLDPTIFESLISGITDANAGRHYDNVLTILQLADELFPDTAIRANLERWAAYEGLVSFPASQSSGNVVFQGDVGTIVYVDSEFKTSDENTYVSQQTVEVTSKVIQVTSLTRSGSTVTATTTSNHGLATNITAIISGANESEYNGSFDIVVTGLKSFTYEITGSPSTPATGTIIVSCDCVSIPMNSDATGIDKNLDSGATVNFVTQITGVNVEGYVDFNGFTGGRDIETTSSLYRRTVHSRSNPVANFNVAAIEKQMFLIQGVTRVLVKRNTPNVAQVTSLFVRDGDDNIIPSASEVNEVNNSILEILPVTSEVSDVITKSPTGIITNYVFTSISPNTPTMKDAIKQSLIALYEDNATFETDLDEDKYRSAIINTIDSKTGERLNSFSLSTPSGDITISTDEIPILGTVSF